MRILFLVVLAAAVAAGEPPVYVFETGGFVLRWEQEGLGGAPGPRIEVLRDGTLRRDGKAAPVKLPPVELQALVHEVVATQKLVEFDDEAVARLVARLGPHCGTGATTTVLRVVLKGRSKTVRVPLLQTVAGRFPKDPWLRRALRCEQRLRLEARLAFAGGRRQVEAWRVRADARRAARFPKLPAFRVEDFREVAVIPDGEIVPPAGADPNTAQAVGRCAVFVRGPLTAVVAAGGGVVAVNARR